MLVYSARLKEIQMLTWYRHLQNSCKTLSPLYNYVKLILPLFSPVYLLSLYGDNNETMDLASLFGKSYLPLQDMTFLEHSPTFRRDDFDLLGRLTQAAIIGRIVTEVDTLQAILISCTQLTGSAFPKIRGLTWSLPPPPASRLFPRGGGPTS
ncbi:hypothetical protein J3E69DRAFT_303332 [Trichoderma sp. SZMC 28015]